MSICQIDLGYVISRFRTVFFEFPVKGNCSLHRNRVGIAVFFCSRVHFDLCVQSSGLPIALHVLCVHPSVAASLYSSSRECFVLCTSTLNTAVHQPCIVYLSFVARVSKRKFISLILDLNSFA